MSDDHQIYNLKLKNGMNCLLVNTKCFNSVTVDVLFKVGSRDEPKNYRGLTHFAEHMFFKGTKNRPTGRHISRDIDRYGGKMNATTDYDITHYFIKIPKNHYTVAMDVLSDMIFNSSFKEKDIESEKKVVIHELESYNSNPYKNVSKKFGKTIFKNTTLEYDAGGSIPIIENATREQFIQYVAHFYQPKNITLVVIGNFQQNGTIKELTSVKKHIRQYFDKTFNYKFDKLANGKTFSPRTYHPNFQKMQQKERFGISIFPSITQSNVLIGFPAYKYNSKNYDTLLVLSTILGEGMSSRLFVNIRSKHGLAYSIGSEVNAISDLGIFIIQCASYTDIEKLNKLLQLVCHELVRLKKGDLQEQELQKAKDNVIGSESLSRENNTYLAYLYGYELLNFNKISNYQKWKNRINKVSIDSIIKLANEIFQPNKINICLTSPKPIKLNQIYKPSYLKT